MHTHKIETCAIANPKSAYMLVYSRLQKSQQEQCTQSSTFVSKLCREVSDVETRLVSSILGDNQQHTLTTRLFSRDHLAFTLRLTKMVLSQRWALLQSLAAAVEESKSDNYSECLGEENAFACSICQGVYFILHFLAKASSDSYGLYTEVGNTADCTYSLLIDHLQGIEFVLGLLPDVSESLEGTSPVPSISNFSSAEVLFSSVTGKTRGEEMDMDQENIPPLISKQHSRKFQQERTVDVEGSIAKARDTLGSLVAKCEDDGLELPETEENDSADHLNMDPRDRESKEKSEECVQENDIEGDEEEDDENMRLALSLSLGESVDVIAEEKVELSSGEKCVDDPESSCVISADKILLGTTALASRCVLHLLLRDLFPSLPLQFCADHSGMNFNVSSVADLLFAPSPEIRLGYAKLLYKFYYTAFQVVFIARVWYHVKSNFFVSYSRQITDSHTERSIGSNEKPNTWRNIAPGLLFHDILSIASGNPSINNHPSFASLDSEGSTNPSNDTLCVALVIHLTRNAMFVHAAENWRRCDGYFWLLRKIGQSAPKVREMMVERDVILQLVDIVLGDLSPICGQLYGKGTRKRAPTSFVSVVPEKSGALPKHALPTSLPDFTELFGLLADLVTSCATVPMLEGKGIPRSFSGVTNHGYPVDAINLTSVQSRQMAYSFSIAESSVPPSYGGQFNSNVQCMMLEVLYSTALKQARYVPALLRMITHVSYECYSVSSDLADMFVRTISFAAVGELGHYFEALATFLCIEDSLSTRRAHMVLDNPGGLFSVLHDLAFVTKNPTKVCVCLTSLMSILMASQATRDAISIPRNTIGSWAIWMLKFCYQFLEKSRREDQMSLALQLSASNSDNSSSTVDEAALLNKSGPYMIVFGEGEDDREISWTARSGTCFTKLQTLLRHLGEEPDALIPVEAFEDYDALTNTTSNNDVSTNAGAAAAPVVGTETVTGATLNVNNKRNVTDLTVSITLASTI